MGLFDSLFPGKTTTYQGSGEFGNIFTPVKTEDKSYVDINRLVSAESSGNPFATNVGRDGNTYVGLTQMGDAAWEDVNVLRRAAGLPVYPSSQRTNPQLSTEYANIYLNQRIPQILRSKGIDVNSQSVLAFYGGWLPEYIASGGDYTKFPPTMQTYFRNVFGPSFGQQDSFALRNTAMPTSFLGTNPLTSFSVPQASASSFGGFAMNPNIQGQYGQNQMAQTFADRYALGQSTPPTTVTPQFTTQTPGSPTAQASFEGSFPQLNVSDYAFGLAEGAQKAGELAFNIGQQIARSGASVALTRNNVPELAIDPTASKVEQAVQRFFFGDEPVKSLATRVAEGEIVAKNLGLGRAALPASFATIGLMTYLDFTTGAGKTLAKSLLKEGSIEGASLLLRKAGVAEDLVRIYAPKFAAATKLAEVNDGLKALRTTIETTNAAGKTLNPRTMLWGADWMGVNAEGVRATTGLRHLEGENIWAVRPGAAGWIRNQLAQGVDRVVFVANATGKGMDRNPMFQEFVFNKIAKEAVGGEQIVKEAKAMARAALKAGTMNAEEAGLMALRNASSRAGTNMEALRAAAAESEGLRDAGKATYTARVDRLVEDKAHPSYPVKVYLRDVREIKDKVSLDEIAKEAGVERPHLRMRSNNLTVGQGESPSLDRAIESARPLEGFDVERRIGITPSVANPEINAEMAAKIAAYKQAQMNADWSTAKAIADDILSKGKEQLLGKFDDMAGVVKIEIEPSTANYFMEPEPTLVVEATLPKSAEGEFMRRVGLQAEEWGQDTVHISELLPKVENNAILGKEFADGFVYEPNIDFRFPRQLTPAEQKLVAEKIQTIGKEGSKIAGLTFHPDGRGLNMYNISKFKPHGQFIKDATKVRDAIYELNLGGISPTGAGGVRGGIESWSSTRRLLVVGNPKSGATRTYQQLASELSPAERVVVEPPARELSTRVLNELESLGKSYVSRDQIIGALNRNGVKQVERELILSKLDAYKSPRGVHVQSLIDDVNDGLIQLTATDNAIDDIGGKWSGIGSDVADDLGLDMNGYREVVYESPVDNLAADVHFDSQTYPGYTMHVRSWDSKTKRYVFELQSDAYQRWSERGLGQQMSGVFSYNPDGTVQTYKASIIRTLNDSDRMKFETGRRKLMELINKRDAIETIDASGKAHYTMKPMDRALLQNEIDEVVKANTKLQEKAKRLYEAQQQKRLAPLTVYRGDGWFKRGVREEYRTAAQNGKKELLFPTGDTALDIEGISPKAWFLRKETGPGARLSPDTIRVGQEITGGGGQHWVIIERKEGGRFRAVEKRLWEKWNSQYDAEGIRERIANTQEAETFGIGGAADEPIYQFYQDDVGKYLKSRYGADVVVDEAGRSWYRVKVDPAAAKKPVEAFGAFAGVEQDEEGNLKYDPVMGAAGVVGARIAKAKRTRGFVQSVRETLPNLKVAGQYIPRDTDELAIRAMNLIRSDIDLAEKAVRMNTDDKTVAIASQLLKHYADEASKASSPIIKNALNERAAKLANDYAHRLTESGRTVQAASILGRLTPEGQLRFAAREIQKYNEMVAATGGGRFGLKKALPELTGAQAKVIIDEMKAINQLPEGVEKAMRFQKLQNKIADLVPTPLMDKMITIWKAGLLTGIKTTGVNIFSNLSHATSEVVKDIPAAGVDSVVSLFTGKRTLGLTGRGIGSGLKEGWNKGWQYLKTGYDERNIGAKLDYKRISFGKGPVARALQKYEETVFRLLGAEDQPFYYAAKARSLQSQAIAQAKNAGLSGQKAADFVHNLVENPTEEMLKYAMNDAQTAVFQNDTALGRLAKGVQNLPGGEIVVPFSKTPSSVAMQIVNYSPAGFVKTIWENIGKGKFDQRLFSQGMGRAITGTAALATGGYLFKNGLMTLGRPSGEREQKLWELEGRKPNAIKVGGKWRDAQVLGPLGPTLLIGGYFQQALQDTGSPAQAMITALAGGAKSFTEQTFLKGIEGFVSAITDPQRSAMSTLASMVGSTIPTIVSDVARATDPFERRTGGSILGSLQARIPGLRQGLEPQVDVLGDIRQRIGNPLEVMADPTRPSPVKENVVTLELRRLANEGYKVSPTLLGDKNGYPGLEPEMNTYLWERTGEILAPKLEGLFRHENYKGIDDEHRAAIVEDFITKAQTAARAEVVMQLVNGLTDNELVAKIQELKASGILTQSVANLVKIMRND